NSCYWNFFTRRNDGVQFALAKGGPNGLYDRSFRSLVASRLWRSSHSSASRTMSAISHSRSVTRAAIAGSQEARLSKRATTRIFNITALATRRAGWVVGQFPIFLF